MTSQDVDSDRYRRARRRAAQLRYFYIHVLVFVLANAANFILNWMTLSNGDNPWWFQWVLVVWSVILGVHGITVLGGGSLLGLEWEERKIRGYLTEAERPNDGKGKPSGS